VQVNYESTHYELHCRRPSAQDDDICIGNIARLLDVLVFILPASSADSVTAPLSLSLLPNLHLSVSSLASQIWITEKFGDWLFIFVSLRSFLLGSPLMYQRISMQRVCNEHSPQEH
jgi:hypothetical protein